MSSILGWVVYAAGACLVLSTLVAIRLLARSGDKVTAMTVNQCSLWLISLLLIPILNLSSFHLLWMFALSVLVGSMLPLTFGINLPILPKLLVFVATAGIPRLPPRPHSPSNGPAMNTQTRRYVTEGWTPAHWKTLFGETTDVDDQTAIVQTALLRYERPLFRLLVAHLETLPEREAYAFTIRLDRYWSENGIRFGNYQPPFVDDLDPGAPAELLARYALGFYDGEPSITGYRGDDDPGAWLRAFLRKRVDESNSWILDDVLTYGSFQTFWINFA